MKNIIYEGLAVSFIGTVLLVCASPIALNVSSLIQRSPLATLPDSIEIKARHITERALNTELNNPDGLTRRTPPVLTSLTPLDYTTPHAYMTSLNASHTRARRHQIELWQGNGVKDLEHKVDSLTASGSPTWLVWECYDQISTADRQIRTFFGEEPKGTTLFHAIEEHKDHIHRVAEKLQRLAPRPPRKQKYVNDNAEARRKRIKEWGEGNQVTALKEQVKSLPGFGYPVWLVTTCFNEIDHTLELVVEFKEKEKDSLDTITKHEAAIRQIQRDLEASSNRYFDERLKELLPKIGEGGAWRRFIRDLVDAPMEDEYMYHDPTHWDLVESHITAGFHMIRGIMRHDPGGEAKVEMNRFRSFLGRQCRRSGHKPAWDRD